MIATMPEFSDPKDDRLLNSFALGRTCYRQETKKPPAHTSVARDGCREESWRLPFRLNCLKVQSSPLGSSKQLLSTVTCFKNSKLLVSIRPVPLIISSTAQAMNSMADVEKDAPNAK